MIKKILKLSSLVYLILTAGCQSLPPGEPPEGPIVTIENDTNTILNEKTAIDRMVTALATSPPIVNANPIAHLSLAKPNAQLEYAIMATSISSNVFRELIATGVADCLTESSGPQLTITPTFVKLQTVEDGNIVFKWNMSISSRASPDELFNYGVRVILKPVEMSTKHIKTEEIVPLFK